MLRAQLFATLDPTLRRMSLPAGSHLVLVDTVGFVGDLPHELVAAFRATLEETRQADLLLHVIDASGPDGLERAARVNEVLSGIDAGDLPQVEVMNKVDRRAGPNPGIERDDAGVVRRVWVSARTGAGIEALAAALGERFEAAARSRELHLPARERPAARASLLAGGGARRAPSGRRRLGRRSPHRGSGPRSPGGRGERRAPVRGGGGRGPASPRADPAPATGPSFLTRGGTRAGSRPPPPRVLARS